MKTKIRVKGMHCRSCEMLLKESLAEISGVERVNVDYRKGRVDISYDESKINLGAIKLAIAKEGYEVD